MKFLKQKEIVIGILVVIIAGGIFVFSQVKSGKMDLTGLSLKPKGQKIAESAIEYINTNILQGDTKTAFVSVSSQGSVYKVKLKVGADEPEVYVSKDGKFLFLSAIDIKPSATPSPQASEEPVASPPQTEKPDVKVFVMSYCPYGLQMEKAYLPVFDLLKGKANMGIYFVDYIMHGKQELDENLKQDCLQKEQWDKFGDYLACFVKSGQSETCLTQVGVNKTKLASCVDKTDKDLKITENYNDKSTWLNGTYPKFDVHKDLNETYQIQGSPTIVINGKQAELRTRSPEAFKNLICAAFTQKPAECSQTLSDTVGAPGFGEGTGNDTGGGCGQ